MSVTADTVIDTIRSKLWDRTYLGHRNSKKRTYFDSIAENVKTVLAAKSPPVNYDQINGALHTNSCIIELIVVFLRNAKNYRTLNIRTRSDIRKDETAKRIADALLDWPTVLTREFKKATDKLIVILSRPDVHIDVEPIETTLFKDLYTLYYGTCKVGGPSATHEVDLKINKLIPYLPEDTELGKFIREIPAHKSCLGNVCSFFTGKKRVLRETHFSRNNVAAPLLIPSNTSELAKYSGADPIDPGPYEPPSVIPVSPAGPPLRPDPIINPDGSIGDFNFKNTKLLSPLGSGGFGDVYKCTLPSSQQAACKHFKRSDAKSIAAARKEAIMLYKFSDTGIFPKFYAFGMGTDKDNKPAAYLFMEWTDGQTLYNMLAWKPKPAPDEIAALKGKIRAMVERLHTYGYVHNDLKPENIYVKQNGDIQLLDIDSCRKIDDRRNEGNTSTRGYCIIKNGGRCEDPMARAYHRPAANIYALSKVNEEIDNWKIKNIAGGSRKTRHRKNVTRKRGRKQSRTTR